MNKIKKIKLTSNVNKFMTEEYHVLAGPFVPYHKELSNTSLFTVNLTAEHAHLSSSLSLPIIDFEVPRDLKAWDEGVEQVLQKIIHREDVFFGCMGGIGRTGILLGCLAKVFGIENTSVVYFARHHLHPHALETQAQIDFVKNFNPQPLKQKMELFHLEHLYKESLSTTSHDYLPDNKLETKTQILLEKFKKNPGLVFEIVSLAFDYDKTNIILNLIKNNAMPLSLVFDKKEAGNFNLLDLAYAYENKDVIKYLIEQKVEPIQEKNKPQTTKIINQVLATPFFAKLLNLTSSYREDYKQKEEARVSPFNANKITPPVPTVSTATNYTPGQKPNV